MISVEWESDAEFERGTSAARRLVLSVGPRRVFHATEQEMRRLRDQLIALFPVPDVPGSYIVEKPRSVAPPKPKRK